MFFFSLSTVTLAAIARQPLEGKNAITNEDLKVSAQGKKGLVVVFLSARCPCSNSHNTELQELALAYKDFNFIGVHSNSDESQEVYKSYFEKINFSFPIIQDDHTKIADQFKAFKTPHAFIISPSGEVLYEGGVSNSRQFLSSDRKYLREALEDIQNGKKVRTPEGRTLGCSIARGKI